MLSRLTLVLAFLSFCSPAVATEEDDLLAPVVFAQAEPVSWAKSESPPIEDVSSVQEAANHRFYVAGIIGNSYETLVGERFRIAPDVPLSARSENVLTGGGAVGIEVPKTYGALRLECEARGRGELPVLETATVTSRSATDSWSTLFNAWRDVPISSRVDVYAGGGVGAGGYRLSLEGTGNGAPIDLSQAVTTFGWQAGGGCIYNVNSRVVLDFGYRFFGLQSGPQPVLTPAPSQIVFRSTTLTASEFLLTVRIYEPFRRWH